MNQPTPAADPERDPVVVTMYGIQHASGVMEWPDADGYLQIPGVAHLRAALAGAHEPETQSVHEVIVGHLGAAVEAHNERVAPTERLRVFVREVSYSTAVQVA